MRVLTTSLAWSLMLAGSLGAQDRVAAVTAYRAGDYDDAISQFEHIVRRDSNDGEALQGLMRALMAVGRYDDAIERGTNADQALAVRNTLGEALVARGRWSEADVAFRAAGQGDPDSLTARLNLALLAERRGDLQAASMGFDRFIDIYNAGRARLSAADLAAVATAVKHLGRDNSTLFQDATRAYQEALAKDPAYMRAELLLGQLFLEKYEGTEARGSFDAVLASNPNDAHALVSKAQALRFANEDGYVELAERALKVNPRLVEAYVFLAMHNLEVQERSKAADLIDQALEVDPRSLEALSVRAALRFMDRDLGAFDAVKRQVLDLNPRYADFYNTLADAAVRGRLYEQAVSFATEAIALDAKSWRAYSLLGINQLRLGKMDEGRANLERGFEGDPFNVWTKNTLDLLDAMDGYAVISSEHFEFVIEDAEAQLLVIYAEGVAEDAYDTFVAKYGFEPPERVRIEILPTRQDFSVRTIGLVGMGALGVSFGPVIAMDAPAAYVRAGVSGDAAFFNWGSTLWHEIAHTFHLGMSGHRVPRWFTEGLAVYEERLARPGWGDGPTPEFLMAYREGQLWQVSELENGFVRPRYPQQLLFSYYQASLVCELIARDYGEESFRKLLASYRSGASNAQAFERALGISIEQFDELFDDYIKATFAGEFEALQGYSLTPDERPDEDEIAARAPREPGDFFAQLTFGMQLLERDEAENAIPYLERAKQLFPAYAGPGSPYWFLAVAKQQTDDLQGAADELEALLERNAGHYRAAIQLGAIQDSLENPRGALTALDQAMFVYPYDVVLHSRLAEVATELREWPMAIRERRAVVALDPVDRADALYELARAYFNAGDLRSARSTVFSSLTIAPNFAQAQDLLLEIVDTRPESRN